MPDLIPVLSLWQPWASLIAIGAKRIETRGWSTKYRGPLAIHAAKHRTRVLDQLLATPPYSVSLAAGGIGRAEELPRGQIIAVVDLASVLQIGPPDPDKAAAPNVLNVPEPEQSFGDYTAGRFAWLLTNVRRLERPVPFGGGQGLTKSIDAGMLKLHELEVTS